MADDKVALVDSDDETENPNDDIPIDEDLQGDDDGAPEWMVKVPILPCWDETDDGVPPFCRGDAPVAWWKVFNPSNRYTNDNLIMIAFGNVGFKYFDKRRKYWMGAAMWSTLISIAFTIAGCFALSTNMAIVKNTNWVYVVAKDDTKDEMFTVHLGLRSMVYTHEPCNPLHCTRTNYLYADDNEYANTFLDGGLAGCRTIAYGTAFGAFTTCATLLFALMGTMNRMRFSSDANIQKALGMITDLCGFISLTATLFNFGSACWGDINRSYTGFSEIKVWMGPGYACYCVCLFGAFMRALFHWVTPLPGRGSGCMPSLPKSLIKKLDRDGDGKVSWEEMKLGYREMVAARRKKKEKSKSAVLSQPVADSPTV